MHNVEANYSVEGEPKDILHTSADHQNILFSDSRNEEQKQCKLWDGLSTLMRSTSTKLRRENVLLSSTYQAVSSTRKYQIKLMLI